VKRPEGFDREPDPPQPTKPGKPTKPSKLTKPGEPAARRPVARDPSPTPPRRERVPRAVRPTSVDAVSPESRARQQRREAKREARRFTRESRRRRLTILIALGLVVVLLGVLAVAVFSPILALRTIRVEGTSSIPASSVQDALSSQIGTPLALVNDGDIRHELSHLILIRSYVTEIVPPNTLVVRIVERKAIGVLHRGAGYQQVDPAGVVLATSATPAGLPVIDIGSSGVNSAGFAAAVKVLLAMPASMLAQVGSISATTLDNVSVTLSQGNHIVEWGSSAQSDLKATALGILLKNPTCSAQTVLNVTAPLALACGPVQPTATPTPTNTPAG
jgi:cell division protein FtsQ